MWWNQHIFQISCHLNFSMWESIFIFKKTLYFDLWKTITKILFLLKSIFETFYFQPISEKYVQTVLEKVLISSKCYWIYFQLKYCFILFIENKRIDLYMFTLTLSLGRNIYILFLNLFILFIFLKLQCSRNFSLWKFHCLKTSVLLSLKSIIKHLEQFRETLKNN